MWPAGTPPALRETLPGTGEAEGVAANAGAADAVAVLATAGTARTAGTAGTVGMQGTPGTGLTLKRESAKGSEGKWEGNPSA